MDKILHIFRGLPGSGKSTAARKVTPLVAEADAFFTDADGNYNFDPTMIRFAHEACQDSVRMWMEQGQPVIAVANTFTRQWEMDAYLRMARQYDYGVAVHTIDSGLSNEELAARNLHGCTAERIAEMRDRWEEFNPNPTCQFWALAFPSNTPCRKCRTCLGSKIPDFTVDIK